MKGVFALLAAAFLCLTFSAVADETSATDPLSSALFLDATPGQPCEPSLDLPPALGGPEPVPMAQNCGACSSANCVGVPRGTRCHLGPIIGGWGWCNIYSGGYMCPNGGWECSCGTGPLP